MAVLYGVFLYMGVAALNGMQVISKTNTVTSYQINAREYRKGNYKWTIQKNGKKARCHTYRYIGYCFNNLN